ncbi:hypothetical protein SAMN05444397_105148 [Flavobacterium aquidurense]|uniref:DUF4468 domain-containing protein n=1 Tax=Flavobacterium frigidimaris TaxID=262320 RepID=A0ABX4BTZ2_FLAFR|nr:hypothetical protein [Flavobacterium frigidimaris]OXA80616.1 hypothetical protein B0A65_06365 [Flavobacterium frigidimaris]SDZ31572.1 hypothetical protein SAMN05444397_105148 [Flavobacterium aquidurense]
MKKIILILITLLFSTVGQAKYLKAVLYLADGTNKTGLAKLVEEDDSKVTFKTNEDADTEKIAGADLIKIVYTNETGNIFTMEYLYLTSAGVFTGKFSNSRKKHWFEIVYNKEYKIGKIFDKGDSRRNTFRSANSSYFFGKKGTDHLVYGYNTMGNAVKSHGTDAMMKKMAKQEFTDCPKISKAIENEIFELDTVLDRITAIFNKTKCK